MAGKASRRSAGIGKARRGMLKLKGKDKQKLAKLLRMGKESVRVIKRAQVLDLASRRKAAVEIAEVLGLGERTVRRIKERYARGGFDRALRDAPRPGAKRVLGAGQGEQLVAVLCGPSPAGRARWTVRLARDEAITRGIVPKVGRETIRVFMRDHALKPWREKNMVRAGVDAGIRREDGGRSGGV